jgi:hypothetical protein
MRHKITDLIIEIILDIIYKEQAKNNAKIGVRGKQLHLI